MTQNENFAKRRPLGVFSLTMINVAAIQSLRNLAIGADLGLESIFYYTVAALLFFIPSSLVTAELAGAWPSAGGVYTWVKEAFGPRWGFAAIFLQWAENVIWYPTVLSFTGATIAYLIDPALASNPSFLIVMIITIFWSSTLFDAFGMKVAGLVSTVGVIAGTVIPALVIISLGAFWFFSDLPSQIVFSKENLIPDLTDWKNLVILTGIMLSFCGIEMTAVHAKDVEHPRRSYPKAIFTSSLIILFLSIAGSLSIATVVPKDLLSYVAGVMQAFEIFFNQMGYPFLTPLFALAIAIGSIAMVATWIVGPSRGLLFAAEQGDLPKIFQKKNAWGMPIVIMGFQGSLVMLLSFVFALMPTVSISFWVLTTLTAILYLCMYILMFAAVIALRFKQPGKERLYQIPGGTAGTCFVASLGLISSIGAIGMGLIPPDSLQPGEKFWFQVFLWGSVLILVSLPHFIFRRSLPKQ